jgi:alpha-amylase
VILRNHKKIDEGYFDKLGINAIWFTPIVEQIHDAVDEGTG